MIALQNLPEILSYASIIPAYIVAVKLLISHRTKRDKIEKQKII
jgi:hypothetical protein